MPIKVLSIETVHAKLGKAQKTVRFARTTCDYEAGKVTNVVHEVKRDKKWTKVTADKYAAEVEKIRSELLAKFEKELSGKAPTPAPTKK